MPTREEIIAANVKPFLHAGQSVLEIGAGNGLVAQMLHDETGADFTLMDVVDYNRSTLPLQLYDGKVLPFENHAFDHILLVFVLHHNPDPRPLVGEALRVARSGAIIVENNVRGAIKRPLTRIIDSTEFVRRGVPRNYFVKTTEEWLAFFNTFSARTVLLSTFKIGWFWDNVILQVEPKPTE